MLQKTAREALGIDLTNQVVVIDEAHSPSSPTTTACADIHSTTSRSDLIPTLLALSTTRLLFRTLETSLSQVSIYLHKFRNRLSANHALHLKRLVTFLDALRKFTSEWVEAKKGEKNARVCVEVMAVGELMQRLGRKAESVNLLEVEAYLRNSKV